ncbi:hypothetical protein [Mumia sp. DW29H23]|uniref:hypothetical protein n=1 Tax=Mumia sp. DW29H23 TaxID=3421241 RepID=UPI003D68E5B9
MRRLTFALAAATLAVATLAGCGGSGNSSDSYCDAVKSAGKKLSSMDAESDIDAAVDSLKKVRDEASGETKENWDTLISSFESMQSGNVEDVDADAVEKAGKALDKQVKDDCDINMDELGN